jgi:hypothetical protein
MQFHPRCRPDAGERISIVGVEPSTRCALRFSSPAAEASHAVDSGLGHSRYGYSALGTLAAAEESHQQHALIGPRAIAAVREHGADAGGHVGIAAAGNQIGGNAMALAAEMKHRLGVSCRKITDLFGHHFGLSVCAGALVRAGQRLARFAEGTHRALITIVQASPVVYADETGWRINARPAWWWVFTHDPVTVYLIREDRSQAVIREVLGPHFRGVLSSDGCASYDPIEVDRQKCNGHILKDLSAIEALKTPATGRFSRETTSVLRDAIALKRRCDGGELSKHGLASARGRLEARMDRILHRKYRDPDNRRLANRLIKHREHLFTFLYQKGVEPTNNHAERALRPAVVGSTVETGCSRLQVASEPMTISRGTIG